MSLIRGQMGLLKAKDIMIFDQIKKSRVNTKTTRKRAIGSGIIRQTAKSIGENMRDRKRRRRTTNRRRRGERH
jgi:hypothetical protein